MKTIIITIIAFIFSYTIIFAQIDNGIIYYDYIPDTSIYRLRTGENFPFDTLFIDIDRSGTDDIKLYFHRNSPITYTPSIVCTNINFKCCVVKSDTVSSDINVWTHGIIWLENDYGNIPDSIGIRYSDGENYYYGWIRADVTSDDTAVYIIVDKTAFCTIPNYDLIWGQTDTSGINITDSTDTTLFLKNINTGNLLVYYPNGIIGEVEIINSSGQLINNRININSDYTEIDITSLQSGMYIVRATLVDNTVVIGKFVK